MDDIRPGARVWAIEWQADDERWYEFGVYPGALDALVQYRRLRALNPRRGLRIVQKQHYRVEDGE